MLIDAEVLIAALESRDAEVEWYLDLVSGQVLPLFSEVLDDDPSFAAALDAEPDRYIVIDPIESHEAFRIMETFVASLPPGAPSDGLASALTQPRPFRHFKDALLAWPHIREQWFRFHDSRMRQVATDWLTENGVIASLTVRTPTGPEA